MSRIRSADPNGCALRDLHVVTVSGADVGRMLEVCEDWQELLCVSTAAYLGARRNALASVRVSDVDLERRTIRFVEKGGKVVVKPMPHEYFAIFRAAQQHGVWSRSAGLPHPESSTSVGTP